MGQGTGVSVVIPAYNGTAFIGDALKSIFAQTLLPREVIVVDDASLDGTGDLVEDLGRSAPVPLQLIRLERNTGGPAKPINIGVAAASGEFIAICDQDDVFLPNKLESQVRVLELDRGISFVFSLVGCVDDPTRVMNRAEPAATFQAEGVPDERGFLRFPSQTALRLFVRFGNFAVGYPGFLFRKSTWERHGGVDERLRIGSDYELVTWMCTEGDVAFLDEIQYLRRVHDGNLSLKNYLAPLEGLVVKSRFLQQEPWLLQDKALATELNDEFYGYGYWAREQGDYGWALRFHRLSLRVWKWDWRSYRALGVLLPHWLRRQVKPSRSLDDIPAGVLMTGPSTSRSEGRIV